MLMAGCDVRTGSNDGVTWHKQDCPVVSPGGTWDAAKCSEPCVYALPDGSSHRLLYEACDGSALGETGVWRVLGATAAARGVQGRP